MQLDSLDHLVLTVRNIDATLSFYQRVLGMQPVTFAGGRKALSFGQQKINLHPQGGEFQPHARSPLPGSADLCFLTRTPIAEVITHLAACQVPIEEAPVTRTGATGPILSIYVRDPDGNLLEIANTLDANPAA